MIRVAAVGDLMLGDSSVAVGFGVHGRYPHARLSEVFSEISPRLKGADLAIGNLECVLAPVGAGATRWARDQMRGDDAYAQVLREAGFSAVAVANNHALQHGEAAFARTVAALRAQGLLVLGLRGSAPWHAEPVSYAHDNQTVALLAYSWRPRQYGEGEPPYADVVEAAVLADVVRARATHDSVIVSLHWGVEFVPQPSVAEVAFAHALVERGADLVIGHHPHVVRGLEMRGTSVIAYSLGNCVTDMVWLEQLRVGTLLEANLTPRPSDVRVTRTHIDDNYRVLVGEPVASRDVAPVALDQQAYEAAGAAGERRQRSASYAYLVRNLFRYRPAVLGALVGTTLSNKWEAVMRRARGKAS